jgi:hypothetical protein
MTPIDFVVTGSKVKITGALTKKRDFKIFTIEALRIHILAMHWLSNLRFGRVVVLEF